MVPGFFPTVPRAELTALLQHLLHAGLGAEYGGDCEHVLDAARDGVSPYHVSSRCLSADLWIKVRQALRDHGSAMPMVKIKAHITRQAALDGGGSEHDWLGNREADHQCKTLARGAAPVGPAPETVISNKAQYKEVLLRIMFVAKWAFRYRTQYTSRRAPGRPRKCHEQRANAGAAHFLVQITSRPGRWKCTTCRREAWTTGALRKLKNTSCVGHIAGACHSSHDLATTRGVLWCKFCGSYTTRQPRALARPCNRKPSSVAAAHVRHRLANGLPPTTADYLRQVNISMPVALDPPPHDADGVDDDDNRAVQMDNNGGGTISRAATSNGSSGRCLPSDGALGRHDRAAASRYLRLDRAVAAAQMRHGCKGEGSAGHSTLGVDSNSYAVSPPAASTIRRRIRGKSAPTAARGGAAAAAPQHGDDDCDDDDDGDHVDCAAIDRSRRAVGTRGASVAAFSSAIGGAPRGHDVDDLDQAAVATHREADAGRAVQRHGLVRERSPARPPGSGRTLMAGDVDHADAPIGPVASVGAAADGACGRRQLRVHSRVGQSRGASPAPCRDVGDAVDVDHDLQAARAAWALPRDRVSLACKAGHALPWTRRIGINVTIVPAPCHLCEASCRTRCSGCSAAVCMRCARERKSCVS